MSASRPDLLGQLLVVGLEEDHWSSSMARHLGAFRPGGVLLSESNLRSPDFTATMLKEIAQTLASRPLLAVEEEGGMVDPLRAFLPPLPSPRAAAAKGPAAVERLGGLIGRACRLLGFNTNLAPTLDLAAPCSNRVLGGRTISSNPGEVAQCGKAFVRGLLRQGIRACGKYFPGLGGIERTGPHERPIVSKPMAALWSEDLFPYRQLLDELSLVMVSHAAYKAYDFDVPRCAMVSANIVEGLLRVKLGYRGIALAHNLEAEADRQNLDLGEMAIQSIMAGCDLLLVPAMRRAEAMLAGLKRGVEFGKLSTRRVEQALKRIRRAKQGLAMPDGKAPKIAFDQLARQFEDLRRDDQPRERKIA